MGKKKEDDVQEEGYDFIPPDFDEDAFIHKEMVSFRTTLTLFVVGIVAALASWGLFAAVDGARVGWLLGMVVFAVFFALLKPLYRWRKIDISHYKRREWIGSAFLLFFTWLGIWLVLLNPPFSDFAEPDVAAYANPGVAPVGGDVVIDVFYTDNEGVESFAFLLTGPDGPVAVEEHHVTGPHYQYVADDLAAGTYTFQATGADATGREGHDNGTFEVRAEVLEVFVQDLTNPTAAVVVSLPLDPEAVYAAYLDLGGDDRVYLEYEEKVNGWQATRAHAGWSEGNNTFGVVVEQRNQFHHDTLLIPGGVVRDDGPYTVEVQGPGDYQGGRPGEPNPTVAPVRSVPGPGVALLAVGLVALAFVARRRRA